MYNIFIIMQIFTKSLRDLIGKILINRKHTHAHKRAHLLLFIILIALDWNVIERYQFMTV